MKINYKYILICLAFFVLINLKAIAEEKYMPHDYKFVVPDKQDSSIEDFIISIKMQGQMGDFYINGRNSWYFSKLLDHSDMPYLVGHPSYYEYSHDWSNELNSGENIIEYIPMRQTGSTDKQQHIKLKFTLKGETINLIEWDSNDLIDNKKITIKITVEQQGVLANNEPLIDTKDISVTKTKIEFGKRPSNN